MAMITKILIGGIGVALLFALSTPVLAQGKSTAKVSSMGGAQVQKPLNVYGQSRSLNMMMVLKGKKDKLQGVNPRKDYSKEIRKTNY